MSGGHEDMLARTRPPRLDVYSPETAELVRVAFLNGPARRVRAASLDCEEALQEIWLRLLRRAQTCPYDPARGAPSTYVSLVVRSATADFLRSECRRRRRDGEPHPAEDAAIINSHPVPW